MGMVDGVHADTADARPAVALGLVLVVGAAGLHDRLVNTATTGNDTDHGAAVRLDDLLGSGRKLDAGDTLVVVVADNGGKVARGAGKGTAVTQALLNVAHNGTFGHNTQRHHVADGQVGLTPAEHKLPSVHALGGDEGLRVPLEVVRVTELDLGEGSTTAWVVDDLADDTADVAVALGKVQAAQLGGSLAVGGVGLEDSSLSFTLR